MRRDNGQVVLAPLYDLVATHMWPELSAKLAMRFGRAPILEDVDAESFASFAEDAGLALPYLRRRAAAMAAGNHGASVDGTGARGWAGRSCLGGLRRQEGRR